MRENQTVTCAFVFVQCKGSRSVFSSSSWKTSWRRFTTDPTAWTTWTRSESGSLPNWTSQLSPNLLLNPLLSVLGAQDETRLHLAPSTIASSVDSLSRWIFQRSRKLEEVFYLLFSDRMRSSACVKSKHSCFLIRGPVLRYFLCVFYSLKLIFSLFRC